MDALIHCAHDFTARTASESNRLNYQGSQKLFRAAEAAGVAKVIFISSMAAYDGCISHYGRVKLAIEKEAAAIGAISVRPGAIYGKGAAGLIGSMRKAVAKLPVVPLIGSGNYPLFTIHEDDLCELLFVLAAREIEHQPSGPISAVAKEPITFRSLLEGLAAAAGKHPVFVPIPWRSIHLGLRIAEACGLRPPFRSDSVLSLVHSNPAPDFNAERAMKLHFRTFSTADL
jgi:nucleoside-diphosphate-sugar epimerase